MSLCQTTFIKDEYPAYIPTLERFERGMVEEQERNDRDGFEVRQKIHRAYWI